MRQLSDILRIGTVAVKEMSLVYQLLQLRASRTVIIPRTQFYQRVAHWRSRHHYYRNLVLHAQSEFISHVELRISHEDADYFATVDPFGSFFALSYLDADIHLHLHLPAPLQILIRVIYITE